MNKLTCINCEVAKPISEFYLINGKSDYYCKYCRTAKNIESQRAGGLKNTRECSYCGIKKHYAKGMCRNCYTRNFRTGSPDIKFSGNKERVYNNGQTYKEIRKNGLMHRYKLTIEDYEKMAKDGCHICGGFGSKTKALHVDHDHTCCDHYVSCGLCVRGILCDACNTAVDKYENNQMRDDYYRKAEIIKYVNKHKILLNHAKAGL